jgi:hypothetical protein
MMKAVNSYETTVNSYEIRRRSRNTVNFITAVKSENSKIYKIYLQYINY